MVHQPIDGIQYIIQQFDDSPAVVFIDGDHKYSVVMPEVDFFIPKMLVGGMMFLHDLCTVPFRYEKNLTIGKKSDMHLVRKNLEERKDVDTLTWRYTAGECGMTMVLKKDMNQPEYRV